jgi:hypothetical protein
MIIVDSDYLRRTISLWQFLVLDQAKCRSPWLLSPLRNLFDHDNMGGHTCVKHVNLTLADLRKRLVTEPRISVASSFWCLEAANASVCYLTMSNLDTIIHWIDMSNTGRKVFGGPIPIKSSIGYGVLRRTNKLVRCSTAEMVLQRIPSRDIFRIVTAYPSL